MTGGLPEGAGKVVDLQRRHPGQFDQAQIAVEMVLDILQHPSQPHDVHSRRRPQIRRRRDLVQQAFEKGQREMLPLKRAMRRIAGDEIPDHRRKRGGIATVDILDRSRDRAGGG